MSRPLSLHHRPQTDATSWLLPPDHYIFREMTTGTAGFYNRGRSPGADVLRTFAITVRSHRRAATTASDSPPHVFNRTAGVGACPDSVD